MISLRKLKIKNFAIVSETEVDFAEGLSVVTGETGTGKSLLVGAISLLMGERGRAEYVRAGCRLAVVEGHFHGDFSRLTQIFKKEEILIDTDLLVLTRELGADGRSRCLVNDRRVSVATFRQIGAQICDLHGQHQHQWLLDPGKHLWFLDRFAGCRPLYEQYLTQFNNYRSLKAAITSLKEEINANQERRQLYRYQLDEIDRAAIVTDEETELEQERRQLENVTRIKERLINSQLRLEDEGGGIEAVTVTAGDLETIADDFPAAKPLAEELESIKISLTEMVRTLAEHSSRLIENPARLEQIGERLAAIYDLKRKYGGSIAAIYEYREKITQYLQTADSHSSQLAQLEDKFDKVAGKLVDTAIHLQAMRERAAEKLRNQMTKILQKLGLSQAQFLVEFNPVAGGELVEQAGCRHTLSEAGVQIGQFLFSANAGEEAKPLVRIASGGEISRVMLALKSLISGKDQVDLLVFDEIDSGIGGETALLVGRQLKELSRRQQVIAITHLQQIAAYSDQHYRAVKKETRGRTESSLEVLADAERVAELGRMISGGELGEEEKRQAEKLLQAAARDV